MNEGLMIVNVCKTNPDSKTGRGWQTPIIFLESQKKEMEKLILDEQLQHNTVTTTWIPGMAVEPLRQHFAAEVKENE